MRSSRSSRWHRHRRRWHPVRDDTVMPFRHGIRSGVVSRLRPGRHAVAATLSALAGTFAARRVRPTPPRIVYRPGANLLAAFRPGPRFTTVLVIDDRKQVIAMLRYKLYFGCIGIRPLTAADGLNVSRKSID